MNHIAANLDNDATTGDESLYDIRDGTCNHRHPLLARFMMREQCLNL